MLAIWLIVLLAGTSCAVFYTKCNNNDYPRIGKRAFFTGGVKGASYPRIGRSNPATQPSDDAALSSFDQAFQSPLKRGIFTSGGRGFPRIGRSQSERSRSGELSATAGVVASVEDPDVMRSGEDVEPHFEFPLGLLFFGFDKDVPKDYGICATGETLGHKPGQSGKENLLLPMQQTHPFRDTSRIQGKDQSQYSLEPVKGKKE